MKNPVKYMVVRDVMESTDFGPKDAETVIASKHPHLEELKEMGARLSVKSAHGCVVICVRLKDGDGKPWRGYLSRSFAAYCSNHDNLEIETHPGHKENER